MSNQSPEQSLDDQLKAMGRLERRYLLLRLATADPDEEPSIDLTDVGRTTDELDPLVTMRHLHLPILEEREFISWNQQNHRVTKGPRFDELEPFLKLFQEIDATSLTDRHGRYGSQVR